MSLPRAKRDSNIQMFEIVEDDNDFDINGGIRIKINKEKRVLNHLNEQPENTNLLFYNFNAYSETNMADMESRERVPTRGMRSRKEFRERQI